LNELSFTFSVVTGSRKKFMIISNTGIQTHCNWISQKTFSIACIVIYEM